MTAMPNNVLESTPVGAFSSAFAIEIVGPAWLSLGRSAFDVQCSMFAF
jgi:hypothetical protein